MNLDVSDPSEQIPDRRLTEIREHTAMDPEMQQLMKVILDGWPSNKSQLAECVKSYFSIRDTLSCQDGIILKAERIVIPKNLRNDMKKRLHSAHLGYDNMMRRARITIFWLGMAPEIKQLAESCEICQNLKQNNQKETLKQHDVGKSPDRN